MTSHAFTRHLKRDEEFLKQSLERILLHTQLLALLILCIAMYLGIALLKF